MDAETTAVLWTVLWFIAIGFLPWLSTVLGAVVTEVASSMIPLFLGWLLGLGLFVLAIVQFVIQLVTTIKILF